RFWAKVRVGRDNECWPWAGAKGANGYGRFKVAGRLVLPHVFAYEYFYDELPPSDAYHGTVVRHACDNPPCCNPAHLIAGTQAANVADMVSRDRARRTIAADTIAAIRAAGGSRAEIAQRFGVTPDQVKWYRRARYAQRHPIAPAAESYPAHKPEQPELF